MDKKDKGRYLSVRFPKEHREHYDTLTTLAKEKEMTRSQVARELISQALGNPTSKEKIVKKPVVKKLSGIYPINKHQREKIETKKDPDSKKQKGWGIGLCFLGLASLFVSAVYLVSKYKKESKNPRGNLKDQSTKLDEGREWLDK